jgi:hypothetical protein
MSPDRAAAILARFNAAHNYLLSRLRDLPPETAEHEPGENAWTPAQIGGHVAMANEWMADVITGSTPLATPAPAGFVERFDAANILWNTKTFPLDPPDVISGDNALERLRTSGHRLAKAIATLSPERGSLHCVTLPAVGTLSLFELADYAVAHAIRHADQLGQAVAKAY